MLKGQNEIRMIWLMILIIIAVSAWFLDVQIISYICGIAFVVSVIQYAESLDKSVAQLAEKSSVYQQPTSRVPLYASSIVTLVGGFSSSHLLVTVGITAWIFFFLRWLKRIEASVIQVEYRLENSLIQPNQHQEATNNEFCNPQTKVPQESLVEQVKHWLFEGNPVLKVAVIVLVIGIVLLLRFATEHWQLSLSLKLAIVALVSCLISVLGYRLINKNKSFALALEGLGLAGLFLTIFFAYYNTVLPTIVIASACFVLVMAITLWLSLKQQSVELALMAMVIAYIAPFTLPIRDATAVEFISYYLIINIAVAVLSTLRPWKFLNQIAFLMTAIVGGGYAFYKGHLFERTTLTVLVLAHTTVFVWLGFRFSQLIAKEDIAHFKLKPTLDIALIFGAPIVGYIFIYLMYFEDTQWQAGLSFIFALVFAGLYQLSKKSENIPFISQSYLSLTLIFLALIPPILLPDQWSVMGWAVEGLGIFVFALYKASAISRYLAIGLLIVAGISSVYYLMESNDFPNTMYWVLSVCYFAVVVLSNFTERFQQQLTNATIAFFSLIIFFATTMLLVLLQDELHGELTYIFTLAIISILYFIINEVLLRAKATWSWLIPKWIGLIPLYIFSVFLIVSRFDSGMIVWESLSERLIFAVSGILLTTLWLRPLLGARAEKEWVSVGALSSMAFTSLTIFPHMPFISVVLLPLMFCVWCYWKAENSDWRIFWTTRNTLALSIAWIICSQIFSQQAFYGYVLPVLNPFDLVSIAILAGFIWMLLLQVKAGLDKGLAAVMMVLSLLWLSSYIVLRALHVYMGTPFNELAIWSDATIQLSFTMLWVSLAFVTMSIASKKQLRAMWILGGSILVIVTLKLVLFDLSHIGTLTRVISFLGAGFVMLIIAYLAPIPSEDTKISIE